MEFVQRILFGRSAGTPASQKGEEGLTKAGSLPKVDVYDLQAVRRAVSSVIVVEMEKAGFVEDHTWQDARLWLMGLAAVVAMVAQFAPIDFPDNRPLLLACVVIYSLLQLVLNGLSFLLDGDRVATFSHNEVKPGVPSVRLRTLVTAHEDDLTVVLEWDPPAGSAALAHAHDDQDDNAAAQELAASARNRRSAVGRRAKWHGSYGRLVTKDGYVSGSAVQEVIGPLMGQVPGMSQ